MRSSLVSLPVLLLVLALLASQAAFAQDESAPGEEGAKRPRFVFDGFGTLGLVHSSEQEADFVTNPVRPDGTGFTREWSGEVDSRLGLQLTAALTKKLTAVVQVIVEQRHDDHYQPTLEWANLKYSFTEDFSVRIGRTALPTFASSDFRKVGYANPWVRPPVELYSLVPIFNSDGIDASYRHRFAGWTHTVQATLGASDVDLPGGGTAEIRELVGLFDTLERGDLTLHGALATARVSIDSANSLFDAFRAFGPEGQSLANRFDVADKRVRFAGLGATYDPGRWFVTAELGRIRTRSLIGDRTAGYVTAGYRVGSFTPYATYSEAAADSPTSSPGLTLSSLPPPLVPPAAALNAALDDVLASIAVQRSLSLGARWDFRKNAALEVQVDRVDVDADSFGTFVNRQPGFERGGEATLFSVATSFVF